MEAGASDGAVKPAPALDDGECRPDPSGRTAYRQSLVTWLYRTGTGALAFVLVAVAPLPILIRWPVLVGSGAFAAYSGYRAATLVRGRAEWNRASLKQELL